MGSSLVSKNMTNFNLVAAKFGKIRAEVGAQDNATGGSLYVGTNIKINKGDEPNQVIGSVEISALALPKGITDKSSFAFRIAVTVDGVFESKGEPLDLADISVEHTLLQSLYVMATFEIVSLAQKLGFPNIKLPLDIKVTTSSAEKPSKRKTASAKSGAVKVKARPKSTPKKL